MKNGNAPMKRGPMGGGPPGSAPVEKAKNFKGSFKRLLSYLKPERVKITVVIIMALLATFFSIISPKIMGNATNILFEGVTSMTINKQITAQISDNILKNLPEGTPDEVAQDIIQQAVDAAITSTSKEDLLEMLRSSEDTKGIADMLEGMEIDLTAGVNFQKILNILIILILVYILSSLFMWAQNYIMAGVTQRVIYELRQKVDLKLSRLPLKYYDTNQRGEILSRVTNDIDNISQGMQHGLTQIITSIVTILGVIVMMFTISPLLAVISLLTLPVCGIAMMFITRKSRVHFTEQWKTTGELNSHIEEMYTGANIVKVFGREKESVEEFEKKNIELYQSSFKAQFISGIIMPVITFINNINYVIICVAGGLKIINGSISLGDVQAFINYSKQFTQPIGMIANVTNQIQSAIASAERVFELLDAQEEVPETVNPVVIDKADGYVKFEDVSFRYVEDKPLIENMNITVKPGQTVAIVGPTGAGKTTLVNLLMRFYELNAGKIYVDGVNITDMRREDLRKNFGMVLQDTWLFSGTIYDNIAYGCENCSAEDVKRAAVAAYVDNFVKTLPDGYNTIINDDANNISQGQRQLLTIARAFLSDPNILILDEATSSVDTRTEILIQKAMSRLMENRTSFVIAHRLSTIRDADIIIVMKDGSIIEQGAHNELLAKKGFYYELYNSQFSKNQAS